MKILTNFLSFLMTGLILTSFTYGQDVGDYGSIASGNWGSVATWGIWNGVEWGTAAASPSSASINVHIRNGHTVTYETSGKSCKNLTVENGAVFISDVAQPTSNIKYLRVAGDVVNNGTIGTPDNLNVISFEVFKNTTFSGSGISKICRIRPRTDSVNVNIIFDTDVTLTYTGGSGTGGVGLYTSNNAYNNNITVTVNPGRTLTFVSYCYLAIGSSGTGDGTASSTFNIHGNLLLEGNTNLNLRVGGAGKTSTLNVTGTVVTARNLYTVSTTGNVPIINVDGSLTIESGNCDLSAPNSLITGTGTFSAAAGVTMQIGHPDGISANGAAGAVQTGTRNFSNEGRYTYLGTTSQSTGSGLPSGVNQLTINNSNGVNLLNSVLVENSLNLISGKLYTLDNVVTIGASAAVNRTNGFVAGKLAKNVTDNSNYIFEVGDELSYTPVSIQFTNLTAPGIITASTTPGSHPQFGGSGLDASKKLNRYYTISNNGTVFDSFDAGFTFVNSDVDAGASTANFLVKRFKENTWYPATTADPFETSIKAAALTEFGDFTAGEAGTQSLITDHFRTKQSGNWNEITTWESSANGLSWVNATVTPYDTAATITIRGGDTVTVTDTVSVDQVTVEENAVIVLNGALFTVRNGDDEVDMVISGTILSNSGSMSAQGIVHFESTSIFNHNQNSGSLPIAVWKQGSTLMITGATGGAPANRSQNFSNIIFDCPNQTGNLNMGFTNAEISGDITVKNTGSGRWYLCGPTTGNSAYVNILGNINHTGGNFASHGTGNGNTTIVVHTQGNITASGGDFSIARGSQSSSGTTSWYVHGNLSLANTNTQNSNPTGAKFIFPNTKNHTLTLDGVTYGGGGLPIEVADTASLDLGNSILRGNAIFTLNDEASLSCGNPGGLDSTLQNTGLLTLSPAANYLFNGTTEQITGIKLPSEVKSLTVLNSSGVVLSKDVEVSFEADLESGDLLLNGNMLDLGTTGLLKETPGNTVKGTTGKVKTVREVNSSGNIAGIGVELTTESALGLTTVERTHAPATGSGNEGILRIYSVSPASNVISSVLFHYDESELNGISEGNLGLFGSTDGTNNTWSFRLSVPNTVNNNTKAENIDISGYWTLADVNNPVPVELSSFTAYNDQYSVVIKWTTATENQNKGWEIERRISSQEDWSMIAFVEGKGTSSRPADYLFRDDQALEGVYHYRLKQVDYNGTYSYSEIIEVEADNMPMEFTLHQNYPNPFNPETVIRFELPEDSFITLSIYNVIGEQITTLINGKMEKGRYSQSFNASNLPTGIYLYRLATDQSVFTRKMILVK